MTFTSEDRTLFAALANQLIPASDGMPSASQAGVAVEWLDVVLRARPDLVEGLRNVLDRAAGRAPADVVADLMAHDRRTFSILAELVPGAYFLNPDVRRAIGYEGQTAQAIDPRPDYLDEGLLDAVISRGPIYRPTPLPGGQG
jgi:hypothetical protein